MDVQTTYLRDLKKYPVSSIGVFATLTKRKAIECQPIWEQLIAQGYIETVGSITPHKRYRLTPKGSAKLADEERLLSPLPPVVKAEEPVSAESLAKVKAQLLLLRESISKKFQSHRKRRLIVSKLAYSLDLTMYDIKRCLDTFVDTLVTKFEQAEGPQWYIILPTDKSMTHEEAVNYAIYLIGLHEPLNTVEEYQECHWMPFRKQVIKTALLEIERSETETPRQPPKRVYEQYEWVDVARDTIRKHNLGGVDEHKIQAHRPVIPFRKRVIRQALHLHF